MINTKIINLIGGPCSGKSTISAGLFYSLKKEGYNTEMALEYVKDKVWEESYNVLNDQVYILGQQFHKLYILNGKVDFVITDSPLIMQIHYNKINLPNFSSFTIDCFNQFNNINYYIERNEQNFSECGRMHSFSESKEIDSSLIKIMNDFNIKYKVIPQNNAVNLILNDLLEQ